MQIDTAMQKAFDAMCRSMQEELPKDILLAVRVEYMPHGGNEMKAISALLERYKDDPNPNPR